MDDNSSAWDVEEEGAEIRRLLLRLKAQKVLHPSIQSANIVADVFQGLLERPLANAQAAAVRVDSKDGRPNPDKVNKPRT